jgi:hypothetical protein
MHLAGWGGGMTHDASGHAALAGHRTTRNGAHVAHVMAAAHASTGSGDASAAPEKDSNRPTQPANHHSCDCSCPGSCCWAPALVANARAPQLASVERFREHTSVFVRSVGRMWTDFVLPFPTPPPATLA